MAVDFQIARAGLLARSSSSSFSTPFCFVRARRELHRGGDRSFQHTRAHVCENQNSGWNFASWTRDEY